VKKLLIYCSSKLNKNRTDYLYQSYQILYPFFDRYIFVGKNLSNFNSFNIRFIHTKEFNVVCIYNMVKENVDVFINGDTRLTNIEGISIPKFFVIADTHFNFLMVKDAIDYLKKEIYDGVLTYAKPEHGRFFWEKNIKTFFWPWVKTNAFVEGEKYSREFDVVYIGHRVSSANIRANNMLLYVESKCRSNNIKFQFFQHTGYENYLKILKQVRISICCTSNGQFTPQIYLMMQSGSLCLLDRPSNLSFINKFFVEGIHYVGWSSFEELFQKILYYNVHSDEVAIIAEAGKKVASQCFLSYHEYSFIEKMKKMSFDNMIDKYGIKKLINNTNILDDGFRFEIYDVVQILHQYYESVGVVIVGERLKSLVNDFIDLPRVEIVDSVDKRDVMLLIAESKAAFYSSGIEAASMDYFLLTEKSAFERLRFFWSMLKRILMKFLLRVDRLCKTNLHQYYLYPAFGKYEYIEVFE